MAHPPDAETRWTVGRAGRNTTLLASAEAVLAGRRFGLDPRVMVETINVSTGRSYSTEYKLPEFVLTGTYDAGFAVNAPAFLACDASGGQIVLAVRQDATSQIVVDRLDAASGARQMRAMNGQRNGLRK